MQQITTFGIKLLIAMIFLLTISVLLFSYKEQDLHNKDHFDNVHRQTNDKVNFLQVFKLEDNKQNVKPIQLPVSDTDRVRRLPNNN